VLWGTGGEIPPVYLRGWVSYFGIQGFRMIFRDYDGWIRSRLRSMQLKKWKKPRKFQRMMIKGGYWSRKAGKFCEGPYGDRKKLMKRLCVKAGVRYFRFHPIRHSGASIMDGNNVPLSAIQRILGHENRKTTEIYLHSNGDLEREAINIFERAREKSHTVSHTDGTQKIRELTDEAGNSLI